jgi:hypothetical protein
MRDADVSLTPEPRIRRSLPHPVSRIPHPCLLPLAPRRHAHRPALWLPVVVLVLGLATLAWVHG